MRSLKQQEKNIVILHGMFAAPWGLFHLRKALEARQDFRRVHALDLGIAHRVVPRIQAEETASWLVEKRLKPRIKSGALTLPCDCRRVASCLPGAPHRRGLCSNVRKQCKHPGMRAPSSPSLNPLVDKRECPFHNRVSFSV